MRCADPAIRLIGFAIAVLLVATTSTVAQERQPSAVILDSDMTPVAGTTDLLTLQRGLNRLETKLLPPAPFPETSRVKRLLGIGYRLGVSLAVDLPQDDFLMVFAHEVYGHGARLREIGAGGIRYGFDAPLPYGPGGAVTEFEGDLLVTRADILAVDTAGIEAQNVLADVIDRQALVRGSLPHREGWLYLQSRLDGLRYIRSVSPDSPEGHDVADFLRDLNDECAPPACAPLDRRTLKHRALLMLAEPFLAYAAYGVAVSYLFLGQPSVAVPMIPLPHDVRYLPALRFEMTPYGTEWSTEHNIVVDRRLMRMSLGVGDTRVGHAWDIGMFATNVVRNGPIAADVTADVWRQPRLDASPDSSGLETGGFAAATARVPLGIATQAIGRIGLYFQAGYKSDGFVRGERLHAGPIVRAGLTFDLR